MDKNLSWKIILIIVLLAVSAWELYPPQETLKPGLDLAGGTSLIYDLDTQGLTNDEIKGLAQRMIPILLKRVDPTNVANIVMRPQGNTRLEIQVPLASADTRKKRKAFENTLQELEADNINLAAIVRALSKSAEQKEELFKRVASDSAQRKQILDDLALSYDQLQELQKTERDFAEQLANSQQILVANEINVELIKSMVSSWVKLAPETRNEQIAVLVGDDKSKLSAVNEYISAYEKWANAANELADPQTGRRVKYKTALAELKKLNLSMKQVTDVLGMPLESKQRAGFIEEFKTNFPDRVDKIERMVAAFEDYRPVRGRMDDPEDVKRMLKGAGVLEFRILPKPGDGKFSQDAAVGYVEALQTQGPKQASDNKYVWCEIENIKEWGARDAVVGVFAEKYYVLAGNQKDESMLQGAGTKPWRLKKAYPTTDRMGRRAIGFNHDEVASRLFHNVTSKNIGRPLCILLDGIAISAPNINTAILSSGVIEGSFTAIQIDDMVNKLNAGSFPARLIEPPVSHKTIGPSIGADNRNQGIKAGFVGLAIVAVFMFIYYVGSGLIAAAALFMNLLFVLAIMALSRATFTLPGIAGIILTIGMAVDANVLIFERIREEQQRGSSLRIAITNGYQKVFRTIFDANVTTFITALILYMVASEEIKGFAITLMLGIVSSMFTALFVTRVVFQFLLDKKIIKNHLIMLQLIRKPNFNWMKARPVFFTISSLLIAAGLGIFFTRDDVKNNKYDIEFTGGTSVQINLKQEINLTRAEVESKIHQVGSDLENPQIAAARVYTVGKSGKQYKIDTTETNKTTVTIFFPQAVTHSVETTTAAIKKAQTKFAGSLDNVLVSKDAQNTSAFLVTTSQVNKTLIKEILQAAFAKDGVEVSEPVVDEIVNRAIKIAFANQLEIQQNLEPKITSAERITESIAESSPEIADFIGGI